VKGTLTEEGDCVVESFHLLTEALRSRVRITAILAVENLRPALDYQLQGKPDLRVALLPERVFESVSGTHTSQGVIVLVTPRKWRIEQLFTERALTERTLVLVLDGVQDPGNAGTMVRAAEAFGASGVLFVKGSASPFHPKTLRAAAGSLFRVPYVASVEPAIARAALEQNRLQVYAAFPDAEAQPVGAADFRIPCAFVIGNEGGGVGPEFRSASVAVTIPTKHVESLNASIAGAILLYEAYRQRHL